MPELPEVEILVRHLRPALRGKTIHAVEVRRPRVLRPTSVRTFKKVLQGARFVDVTRRGKYLLFEMRFREQRKPRLLVGHLRHDRPHVLARMRKAPAQARRGGIPVGRSSLRI